MSRPSVQLVAVTLAFASRRSKGPGASSNAIWAGQPWKSLARTCTRAKENLQLAEWRDSGNSALGRPQSPRLQAGRGRHSHPPESRGGRTREAALRGPNSFFTLFDFSAKNDPVPTMLIQDHVNAVPEFLGQSTGFHKDRVKSGVLVLGEVEGANEAKYLHGQFGRGTFTFLGGHDPEDYQHMVGDPPTELSRYKHSPGYRLILNNVLFPAAEKKKQRT